MTLSLLLRSFLNDYFPEHTGKYTHAMLGEVGGKLAVISKRQNPYKPQYLVNILNENYGKTYSSAKLERAIMAMAMELDGVNPLAATHTQQVEIFAEEGAIKPGAVILGKSKTCANPGCRIIFVPRVPHAKACSIRCAREIRNIRRRKR